MVFPVLETEMIVQAGDKTRLSGVKSFSTPFDRINKVRIKPSETDDMIEVSGTHEKDWYLDWVYTGPSKNVVATLEIVSDKETVAVTKPLAILSAADDRLYSSDQDLEALEPKILGYVPEGRSSFLNVHREARNKILETLADRGIRADNGLPLPASVLSEVSEVKTWARYLTLALIFQGMTLNPDDIFAVKARQYFQNAEVRAEKAYLSLDLDNDGTADEGSPSRESQISSGLLRR